MVPDHVARGQPRCPDQRTQVIWTLVRKYFTRRCIGLHVTAVILIPAFLLAAWWQYTCALGGNDLSWAYVFEWPCFAVYAAYVWWKLIHDQHTPFNRLWAARARMAADAMGTPLNQIPGWALDKGLSRSVIDTSMAAANELEMMPGTRAGVLASAGWRQTNALATSSISVASDPFDAGSFSGGSIEHAAGDSSIDSFSDDELVIDVSSEVVRVVRDEELDAYNRYLADLSWRDPPKRWGARQG